MRESEWSSGAGVEGDEGRRRRRASGEGRRFYGTRGQGYAVEYGADSAEGRCLLHHGAVESGSRRGGWLSTRH